MNAFVKFLAGLAAVLAIGLAAFILDGTPGSAASAQRKLKARAVEALGPDAWASVTMDGQKAIVYGAAPTEEARQALIARIAAADGSGGLVSGGVTAVDASGLTVAKAPAVASPYIFIVEHEGGALAFSGYAPDQETRDAVYRLAGDLFPDTDISGQLDIAGGAPASAQDWRNAAETSLRALYYLRHGAVSVEDDRFSVTGVAEDEVRAGAARMLVSGLPAGLTSKTNITLDQPPAEPAPEQKTQAVSAPEETAKAETGAATAPENCLAQLEDAVSALRIHFPSADSDLDADAKDGLRTVAERLAACPGARLKITGHTDSLGQAPDNLQLSLERARIVREYLIVAGAPIESVAADGAGESEPVANNASEAGRERNRRIEFEIISTGQ